MQYRNDTAEPVIVAADPPIEVGPGEVVDSDGHVAGLTLVGPDELADDDQVVARITEPAADDTGELADELADGRVGAGGVVITLGDDRVVDVPTEPVDDVDATDAAGDLPADTDQQDPEATR